LVSCILAFFKVLTGQTDNFNRSGVFLLNVDDNESNAIEEVLGKMWSMQSMGEIT
jgi:hypothetical protein